MPPESAPMAEAPTTARDALLFLACLLAVTALYLWPFRLTLSPVFHVNDAAMTADPPGVTFARNGMLRTREPPAEFYRAFAGRAGLTVEARVTTASLDQSGPARIVTASADPGNRNFTLAQEGADLVFRLRASAADANGVATQAQVPAVFVPGREQHLAVSYDLATLAVYVDGTLRGTFPAAGDLSAWDPGYHLAVGNELTGDRPWRGTDLRRDDPQPRPEPALPGRRRRRGGLVLRLPKRLGRSDARSRPHAALGLPPRHLSRPPHATRPPPRRRRPSFAVFAILGGLLLPLFARGRPLAPMPSPSPPSSSPPSPRRSNPSKSTSTAAPPRCATSRRRSPAASPGSPCAPGRPTAGPGKPPPRGMVSRRNLG